MNFDLPHRISNFGETDRVHLVFDIIVNDQIKSMFEAVGAENKKLIEVKDRYSQVDKANIISSLRALNTDVAHQMADEMEKAQNS